MSSFSPKYIRRPKYSTAEQSKFLHPMRHRRQRFRPWKFQRSRRSRVWWTWSIRRVRRRSRQSPSTRQYRSILRYGLCQRPTSTNNDRHRKLSVLPALLRSCRLSAPTTESGRRPRTSVMARTLSHGRVVEVAVGLLIVRCWVMGKW